MSMTLYGSPASPYVRRIRMYLDTDDYTFKVVDVYDDNTRAEYAKISPIRKLPVLEHNGTTVFDSRIIYQYLRQQRGMAAPAIAEHNLVSAVDAVTDSLIILLMTKRSGLEPDPARLIIKLQLERIPDTLQWLNTQALQGAFDDWHYPAIALISLIDWAVFRELYSFEAYPALLAAVEKHSQLAIVQATTPR